jgi:hypothetical protein
VNNALIIGNKEIKTGITGTGTKGFYKLFHYQQDGDISNGDGIEWTEVMYDTEGALVTFDHTEPPRSVSSIGRFICTRCYFVTDNFDEFVVETMRDGDVLVDPQHMQDGQDAHWREEILPELSFFLFDP